MNRSSKLDDNLLSQYVNVNHKVDGSVKISLFRKNGDFAGSSLPVVGTLIIWIVSGSKTRNE
jgi:hypothetical protein